jgi:hypothetical protein
MIKDQHREIDQAVNFMCRFASLIQTWQQEVDEGDYDIYRIIPLGHQ